jgi:hypothetical protein
VKKMRKLVSAASVAPRGARAASANGEISLDSRAP